MHWYTEVIRRYADFDGRSGRPEFWWFTLANLIVVAVLWIVLGVAVGFSTAQLVVDLYSLGVLLPSIGVEIRRLHDTNRSGWWILIAIIPIVGSIILIVFLASAGTAGANRYGEAPAPVHV